MNEEKKEVEVTFDGLNISKELLFVLNKNKFIKPTPIQHQVIPIALSGKDVVGIAQTGTGKTLAFGIPMIQNLITKGGQGLILLPTRELALQADEVISKLGSNFKLRTAVLIGGASINNQIVALKRNPKIIIATPGRLADHLEHKTMSLKDITMIVLDEADRMFDVGFAPQIKAIMQKAPKERQTLLFSATMPKEIIEVANAYMETPLRIEIAPAGTTAEFVEQEMYMISKEGKAQLIDKVLEENKGSVLIFVRTRYGAKRLTQDINAMGHKAAEIHSDRSLFQRKEALAGFKSGKYRVLIATDIAARGIDVKEISLVVNYDLPDDLSDYVHRIGRTGRNGCLGRAISFVTKQEKFDIQRIEKMIKKEIKLLELGELPERRKSAVPQEERFYGRRRNSPVEEEYIEADREMRRKPNDNRGSFSRKPFSSRKPSSKPFSRPAKKTDKPFEKKFEDKKDDYRGRSAKGGNDRGKSKFHGKRGTSNAQKRFR